MVCLPEPPTSPPPRGCHHRRPRNLRVSVAIALQCLATLTAAVAVWLSTVMALSAAVLVAVVCGWLAVRILHGEVQRTWRNAARDHALLAASYRDLHARSSDEHLAFVAAMADRLAARDREVRELEGTLRLSEARACAAEARVRREARRVDEARDRILELEVALAIRRAEEADELATWTSAGPDVDTVVDLLAWQDREQPDDSVGAEVVTMNQPSGRTGSGSRVTRG